MTSSREGLLAIIARAASPAERAAGGWFVPLPAQPPGVAAQRAAQWAAAVTGGDQALFEQYVKARGLDAEGFTRALSDGAVGDGATLPEWAAVFLELMEAFASAGDSGGDYSPAQFAEHGGSNPFDDVLLPFLLVGGGELRRMLDGLGVPVSDKAAAHILRVLAARLASALIHVVDSELQTLHAASGLLRQLGFAESRRLDGTYTGWLARFNRYPVLAYVISVVYRNWREYVSGMLRRLARDRALLEGEMFGGGALGALDEVIGDAGDLHDHGSSVALLVFDSGRRLAYKPKDLRISAAFLDLVTLLNNSGLKHALHTRRIITRGGYSWEEWVEHRPCGSAEEVDRFYQRMGMLVRLLQLLGARDFWLDNLIACGEHPVFIDLEMAFQQAQQAPTQLLPAERAALARLMETPVPLGAITMVTPIGRGVKAEDLGALTPTREFRTPFKFSYSTPLRAILAPELERNDNTRWSKTDYAPVLGGRRALAAEHFESLLAGYREMNDCLRANRSRLLSEDSPLRGAEDFPLRHIHRDTWTCLRMINDSTRTPLLVDGFYREMFFEGLMRMAADDGRLDATLVRIVESEIGSMRELDVPLFRAPAGRNLLLLSGGGEIPDYFHDTSLARAVARIASVEDFPLEEQIDFIRSCFQTGPHEFAPPSSPPAEATRPEAKRGDAPAREYWLDAAVGLGDFILAQSDRGPEGDLAWLGLIYHPDIDMRAVDVLRPDLLSGTCGLAVLFARLYELTGEARFRDATRGALASTVQAIEGRHPLLKMLDRLSHSGQRLIACGAYYGVGSQVYALRRCAQALGDPGLTETAAAYFEMLPLEGLAEQGQVDLVCGLAGLLLSVAPFEGEPAGAAFLRIAEGLGPRLLDLYHEGAASEPPPYPPGARLLESLPDTPRGLALCFARLHRALGGRTSEDLSARLAAAAVSLADAPTPAASVKSPAWADLLIRHALGLPLEEVTGRVEEQLSADPGALNSEALLGRLELAFTAFRVTGDGRHHARAAAAAQRLIDRKRLKGSWFPDGFAPDRHNLSVVHGLGAAAHYFTCLYEPERARSILALE